MQPNYISVEDLAAYAPELDTSAYSTTTVSGIISRASRMVDSFTQTKGFYAAVETNERGKAAINASGDLYINVRRRPIVSVQAIRIVKGAYSMTLDLTANGSNLYQISDPATSLIYPSYYLAGIGTPLYGTIGNLISVKGSDALYEIDYTAGYYTIPDEIKEATTLFVRSILSTRANPNGVSSFQQGSYSETYTKGQNRLVASAQEILMRGGYVRTSIF